MTYQVLARKWRPQAFDTTVGQQHVLKALSNALEQNRLHHAYLFTGTRGVGKTTIARIFAKALNCEKGVSAHPCGECDACKEIEEGRFIDLIEVDAASKTKVEDTRDLLDNVQYAPTRGRFKIYLIDEVHMLSTHSFNALLKTLEEPPPHVKFLLATTDPQKLPVTVLSRCLQFHLKSLSIEQISNHLRSVLNEENTPFEEPALIALARAANGSIRDSLSLLEQAIAHCEGNVTAAGVSEMLGMIDQDSISPILEALINKDGNELLNQAQLIAEKALDFEQVLSELASILHYTAIAQTVPDAINRYQTNAETIQKFADKLSKEDVQLFYQIAIMGKKDIGLAPDPRSGFEMTLLRMLAFHPVSIPAATASTAPTRPAAPTAPMAPAARTSNPAAAARAALNNAPPPPQSDQPQATTQAPPPPPAAQPAPVPGGASMSEITADNWAEAINKMNLTGMTKLLAMNCSFHSASNDAMTLTISPTHSSFVNERGTTRLNDSINKLLGKTIRLSIEVSQQAAHSPAEQQAEAKITQKNEAFAALNQDPNIQEIVKTFDVNLSPDSVKPN
jgi:DNA polymerase-3 subunit gamma/tau